MQGNFQACLDFVMSPQEDGQPFHVTLGDSGGETSYGVTRATWSRWIGRPASTDEMKQLTASLVGGLYQAWYWNTIAGDLLPGGVDLQTFDAGVLGGEQTAAQQLQSCVGAVPDGHIGPKTLAAVAASDPIRLINKMTDSQEAHYRSLSDFGKFGRGWLARLSRRTAAALAMASASPTV